VVAVIRRTLTPLLVAAAFGLVGASCSGPDDDIVFEFGDDWSESRWTASGGPVDRGTLCPEGRFQSTGYLDLDGSPLAPAEGWELKIQAMWAGPDAAPTYRELYQHVCDDGSGWFTVAYGFGSGGEWNVTDGAGAYREMRGSGPVVVECETLSTDPDTPPCLEDIRTTITGTLEF
jgi:hypothetical protein